MAWWTRSRVFAATSGLSFSTKLTVARETPQCRATSMSVTRGMKRMTTWEILDRSKSN